MRTAQRRGLGKVFARFNTWFDHQANRYGKVIEWALHHRMYMAFGAVFLLVAALGYQATFGRSEFLPKSDYGTLAIEVRTPSSTSLEYARDKVEKAAELARQIPEVKSTDSRVNSTGGRVWVDVGDKTDRKRGLQDLASDLRERLKALVGAEYVVLDDLNNGARKPVQIQFYGTDSRKLMELTNQFMDEMRKIPGAVDVGLSEQDPKDELRIELDRGVANQLGISVNDAAQTLRVAFAGVEVGDWVDPTGESRDVAVRLSPEDRLDASNIEHLPIAVTGTNMMVPLEQIATITIDKGPARIQHYNGKRTVTVSANVQGVDAGTVSSKAKADRGCHGVPGRVRCRARWRVARSERAVLRNGHRAAHGHLRDVPGARDAVRLVHRAAAHHAVAAVLADRRGARAQSHRRLAESHEPHRRDHAHGPGRQERHPAARLRARRRTAGHRPRRSAHACRPRASAPDPHDHVRADGRHDAGGHRCRRRRRVLLARWRWPSSAAPSCRRC